jgi:hypothetical protein
MREAGRCPVGASRSVLSRVTRAVTLITESLGRPGQHGQGRVGGDDGGNSGVEPAGVEGAGLDDQDRAPFDGPAAARLAQISPADAAADGHQSSWRAR